MRSSPLGTVTFHHGTRVRAGVLGGMPNRVLSLERLKHAVDRGSRSSKVAAVLFADLDGFKAVNDRHGHAAGDELLVEVAARLAAVVRPADTLARLSGDEFGILCEDLQGATEADEIAQRVVDAMREPFALSCGDVQLGVSVGVAESPTGAAPRATCCIVPTRRCIAPSVGAVAAGPGTPRRRS